MQASPPWDSLRGAAMGLSITDLVHKFPRSPSLPVVLLALSLGACGSPDDTLGTPVVSTPTAAAYFSGQELAVIRTLSPSVLPPPPVDASNRFADDAAAARLGQKLFFETRFSGKLWEGDNDGSPETLGVKGQAQKISCSGCHLPRSGFSDTRSLGRQISLGASWGRRHTPSLLDVGQFSLLMWDGSRDSLHSQVFGPVESPVEMNSSRLFMAYQMLDLYKSEYEAIFGPLPDFHDSTRFPVLTAAQTGCQSTSVDAQPACVGTMHGMPGDHAEFDGLSSADQDAVTGVVVNVGKAIAAYERKLMCGPGRFDQFVQGKDGALSDSEKRGLKIFVGKGQCVTCHSGPYFTDRGFHNVGLMAATVATVFVDANDRGAQLGLASAILDPLNVRGPFSDGDDGRLPMAVPAAMEGSFKTPGLRCVSRRPSFLHTGQFSTLADLIRFFSAGGSHYGFPGVSEIKTLNLGLDEQSDLVNFMSALDGGGPSEGLLSSP